MHHDHIYNESMRMAARIVNGNLVLEQSLLAALDLSDAPAPRISAVGAGGKTTTLKRLAAEYTAIGRKPIVITTTHMFLEDSPLFLADPSIEEILALLEKEGCAFAGGKAEKGKIKMLSDDVADAVLKLPNPVLIEADGAKRLPAKFPAGHEPVLLPQTTHVLSVYGMDALGRKIEETCFRPDKMAEFLDTSTEHILTEKDIAMLAQSTRAGKKDVKKEMHYTVILNKADTPKRCRSALEIWGLMEHNKDINVVVTAHEETAMEMLEK